MSQTLEQRVAKLESKLAQLTSGAKRRKPGKRAWLQSYGLSKGDEVFKEITRLGREYRQSLRDKESGARS